MPTVSEITAFLNTLAPFDTKCSWDNCGLLVGDKNAQVNKIGFCLDLTRDTLSDAKEKGVQLIVTHHPIIFKPQKSFLSGNLAYELAVNSISAVSVHTCYDIAEGGVNDVLCELLGLAEVRSLCDEEGSPILRIGSLEPTTGEAFARHVAEVLSTTVRLADSGNSISRVALCSGSGGEFASLAAESGADAFVTGDASHHHFLDALSGGMTLIAAGHFETENPAMPALAKRVKGEFPRVETVILKQDNPIQFVK